MLAQSVGAARQVYGQMGTQYGVAVVPSHTHNGTDANRIPYGNMAGALQTIEITLPSTSAATAANYGTFWVAPFPCALVDVWETHQVAGTAGGTVSLTVEKLTPGVAPDSGVALLISALSLKTTANTPQRGNVVTTTSSGAPDATLVAGDRLCLKDAGTLTTLSHVTVTCVVRLP